MSANSEIKPEVDEQEPYQKYNVNLNKKRNVFLKMDALRAFQRFHAQELYSRYNNYSLYLTNEYLKKAKNQDFWKTMADAMLTYDHNLSEKDIQIGICDEFSDWVYIPSEKRIILCANVLTLQDHFENALHRQLIKFYDHLRSKDYNFSNCKHLA